MKPAVQLIIVFVLTLAFSQTANACVSMGQHTCKNDCLSWNGIIYEACIWGATLQK